MFREVRLLFLWGHWYPCFLPLVTSVLGFKTRTNPLYVCFVACMQWIFPSLYALLFLWSSVSPLVQHLLTSTWPELQPSPFDPLTFSNIDETRTQATQATCLSHPGSLMTADWMCSNDFFMEYSDVISQYQFTLYISSVTFLFTPWFHKNARHSVHVQCFTDHFISRTFFKNRRKTSSESLFKIYHFYLMGNGVSICKVFLNYMYFTSSLRTFYRWSPHIFKKGPSVSHSPIISPTD